MPDDFAKVGSNLSTLQRIVEKKDRGRLSWILTKAERDRRLASLRAEYEAQEREGDEQ